MNFVIMDFGSAQKEALRLAQDGAHAIAMFPVMEEIVVDMLRIEGEIFVSQGRRGGGSWKALKPDTIRKKGNTTKLITYGARKNYKRPRGPNLLYDSMVKPGARYQEIKVYQHTIHFGTKRPWAAVHQFGSKRVPRRVFLKFEPYDIHHWAEMMAKHVTQAHREAQSLNTIV